MIIVMARIDWSLAGVALTVVPIIYVLTRVYSRRLKSQWRQAKEFGKLHAVGRGASDFLGSHRQGFCPRRT